MLGHLDSVLHDDGDGFRTWQLLFTSLMFYLLSCSGLSVILWVVRLLSVLRWWLSIFYLQFIVTPDVCGNIFVVQCLD